MRTVSSLAAVAVAAAGGASAASDKPLFAPIPDWVSPLQIPSAPKGGPTEVLLLNQESRFTPAADEIYVAGAVAVNDDLALSREGNLALSWRPETQTLTLHRFEIHRGDQVIDLLAERDVAVLRREPSLEAATLDGALTATVQAKGLQKGDVLVEAFTLTDRDPIRHGHSEGRLQAMPQTKIDHLRLRALWSGGEPIRWKADAPLGAPDVRRTRDGTELVIDRKDFEAPPPPKDAPPRYQSQGRIAFSAYTGWPQLSAQFAEPFEAATALAPDSPVKAEIARIAAASPDPRVRAGMALQLVESQIRYFALVLGAGGYIPATADETWKRRFGDCKAKSVLLTALLRGLGIEATPALASSRNGDGLPEVLPAIGDFDHVIVRAQVAGKTVWMDATRLGDRSLDDLDAPHLQWALPLTKTGSQLAAIDDPPPALPLGESLLDIDMTKGPDAPAPVKVTVLYRGDGGHFMRLAWESMNPQERERKWRDEWSAHTTLYTIDKVEAGWDEAARAMVFHMTGVATIPWTDNARIRQFFIPDSNVGADVNYRRPPIQDQSAPFANSWPHYNLIKVRVSLPQGGAGFQLEGGEDVDATIGGTQFHRRSRLSDGVVQVEVSTRNTAREFPAGEALADEAALRKLNEKSVWIAAPLKTATPKAAAPAAPLTGEAAELHDVGVLLAGGKFDEARARADQGLAKFPKSVLLLASRASADIDLKDFDSADRDLARIRQIDPDSVAIDQLTGRMLLVRGDASGARTAYEKAIAKRPLDLAAFVVAGEAFERAGKSDIALDYFDRAIDRFPVNGRIAQLLNERCWTRAELGKDLELAKLDCDTALKLRPDDSEILDSRGLVELRQGALDAAVTDYDAALAKRPTQPTSLYGRGLAKLRKGAKLEGQTDLAAAVKADPKVGETFAAWGLKP